MAPLPTPAESDISYNLTALALARCQRLTALCLPPLLPPPSSHPLKTANQSLPPHTNTPTLTPEENEEEEAAQTTLPDTLGFGATLPKEGDVNREDILGNERLRKQLLGRDYAMKRAQGSGRTSTGAGAVGMGMGMGKRNGNKSRPTVPARREEVHEDGDDDDDEEEEAGRCAVLGKAKRAGGTKRDFEEREHGPTEDDGDDASVGAGERGEKREVHVLGKGGSQLGKRGSNYLDEVLAERALKKRKKRRKKKKKDGVVDEES